MNSLTLTDKSKDARYSTRRVDQLDEPWFDEAHPSSRPRPTMPPIVHLGEFLGDPEVDAWLR